ncbi:hypothetical protein SCUCBS95973_002065 [Sporothrix curviconia]|uniref:Beta-xylosidase C-terminal Concanavalin A-like domain-containing protein n=1 Tax=Sporothrix curviconia TaxID=1260050 RepID=A0ABP0B3Z1_9PEZI
MSAPLTLARFMALLPAAVAVRLPNAALPHNATLPASPLAAFTNPILPGFHPDPSCIHVADADDNSDSLGTFFCVSSSFSAFPGLPIHASSDLQHWSLVGHVVNRRTQLPELVTTNRSTSGLWAATLRYHAGTFYVTTALVNDERPQTDVSRWDNLIFQADDLYDADSWTDPTRFNFTGYDPSPFWDDDGRSYIVASHAWQLQPGIHLAEVDLDTGDVLSDWRPVWAGTGGLAPESPHIYRRGGWYYLVIAEGGTGLNHMATMAHSRHIRGPYSPCPHNPVLTNANTTSYFQTVGHADLFEDAAGHWWAVALATRSGPEYANYPMGRETVLTPVEWPGVVGTASYSSETDAGWPRFSPVNGTMRGPLSAVDRDFDDDGGDGDGDGYTSELLGEDIDFSRWHAGQPLPPHFTYWRPPIEGAYEVVPLPANLIASPAKSRKDSSRPAPNSSSPPSALRLLPSTLNLTGLDGNYAGPGGQSFVGRRQQHTLFTFRVDLTFQPTTAHQDEAGISVFLTQNHHLDLGLVRLEDTTAKNLTAAQRPSWIFVRFRGITTGTDAVVAHLPAPVSRMVPAQWHTLGTTEQFRNDAAPLHVTLEIDAANATHYLFSAWPTLAPVDKITLASANNDAVSWGFTGALLGVYCTTNGGGANGMGNNEGAPVYVNRWQYTPRGQIRG